VANLFSVTNMGNLKAHCDQCTGLFIDAIRDLEDQDVDLGAWVQWHTFDVIASVILRRRFEFLKRRKNADSLIGDFDALLNYVKVIGQFLELHEWLLESEKLVPLLKK
jgi:hypothetical protein